jgi:hypothetical protein
MPVKMIVLEEVTVIEAGDETLKVFITKNAYTTSACTVTVLSC